MHSFRLAEYISSRNTVSVDEANCLIDVAIDELIEKLSLGENVELPGLGRLTVKNMPGRTSVFFEYSPSPSFDSSEENMPLSVFEAMTELLQRGETIILSSLGTFKSIAHGTGGCRVSFILSPALRSKLNKQPGKEKTVSAEEPQINISETEPTTLEPIDPELIEPKDQAEETDFFLNPHETLAKARKPKIRKQLPLNNTAREFPTLSLGWSLKKVLFFLSLCALLIFLFIWILSRFDRPDHYSDSQNELDNTVLSLADLSKKHYGHPAYWVYIYDANREKLRSPFMQAKASELIFPDLKTAYNVDLTDTLEIISANMIAEELLKKQKIKNTNYLNE